MVVALHAATASREIDYGEWCRRCAPAKEMQRMTEAAYYVPYAKDRR
jgi:hypothetical protein